MFKPQCPGRQGWERAGQSPESLGQGRGQVGCLEEEALGLQLEGHWEFVFWRDEERVF